MQSRERFACAVAVVPSVNFKFEETPSALGGVFFYLDFNKRTRKKEKITIMVMYSIFTPPFGGTTLPPLDYVYIIS